MSDAGVITAFGSLVKGFQALKNMVVSVEVRAKVTELYDVIIIGQQSALESNIQKQAMLETIGELKEKLRKIETWEATKQRYVLHKFNSGNFAYLLKEESQAGEPPHYICATCYENDKKSILHIKHDQGMSGTSYVCKIINGHGFWEG